MNETKQILLYLKVLTVVKPKKVDKIAVLKEKKPVLVTKVSDLFDPNDEPF